MMNARQILQSALDKLGPNGEHWQRFNFKSRDLSGNYSYCTVGALQEVVDAEHNPGYYREKEYMKARNLLQRQVILATGGLRTGVMSFNDHGAKSFADVRRIFQKAINRAAHRVIYRVS